MQITYSLNFSLCTTTLPSLTLSQSSCVYFSGCANCLLAASAAAAVLERLEIRATSAAQQLGGLSARS